MAEPFDPALLDRYRKVRAHVERNTGPEQESAQRILAGMEENHPGIGAAVAAADAEPRVRRREAPPPPPPAWRPSSAYRPPPPPPPRGPTFDPRFNPYAPPPGFDVQYADPDAFNGNPWRSRAGSGPTVTIRSRWADPEPHSPFTDDGSLPPGYGEQAANHYTRRR